MFVKVKNPRKLPCANKLRRKLVRNIKVLANRLKRANIDLESYQENNSEENEKAVVGSVVDSVISMLKLFSTVQQAVDIANSAVDMLFAKEQPDDVIHISEEEYLQLAANKSEQNIYYFLK